MTRDSHINRRDFLRNLGRVALAGLLVGGVGALIAGPDEDCINLSVCPSCPALQGCRLPQAQAARITLSDE